MNEEQFTENPTESKAFPDTFDEEPTADEKMWGMFCHLSAVAAGVILGGMTFAGPLVCWLVKKDSSRFVDEHGKESLNFQINIMLYSLIILGLGAATCGFGWFLFVVLAPYAMIMPILAGLQANEGKSYQYPATFRLIQ